MKRGKKVFLSHEPGDAGAEWIYKSIELTGKVTISKRFTFLEKDLVTHRGDSPDWQDEPVHFLLSCRKKGYQFIEKRKLNLDNDLYISEEINL